MKQTARIGQFSIVFMFYPGICTCFYQDFGILSQSVTTKELRYINSLSKSLLHIINFDNFDINLAAVFQPVVLLQYYASDDNVIPVEFSKRSSKNLNQSERFRKSINYVGILFEGSRLRLGKNLNCEVTVYLHPPNPKTSPSFYHKVWWAKRLILKDPFGYKTIRGPLKYGFLSTIPLLSLLICKEGSQYICSNEHDKETWLSSVVGIYYGARSVEAIQIWESLASGELLSMLCQYCNPCNPFEMVDITNYMLNGNIIFYENRLLDLKSMPHSIKVVLYWGPLSRYGEISEKGAKFRMSLLNHITKIDLKTDADFLLHSIDIYATTTLFPENATLKHSDRYERYPSTEQEIFVHGCPKLISYPGKLRPILQRNSRESIAQFQDNGLIFQRVQFQFVSCHKETLHWMSQLRELVFAFDATTWVLIMLMVLVVVHTFAYTLPTSQNRAYKQTYSDTGFYFSSSLLDQSTKLFDRPIKGRIFLFWLPLMLLVLSNEYKGENITNLTVQPALIPFDTFDVLVEKDFGVRSRRSLLDNKSIEILKGNVNLVSNYSQQSAHEAYPIVSELWQEILLRFRYGEYAKLGDLRHRISSKSNFYLNHSQVLPEWKLENGEYGSLESLERILSMHMNKCAKTAMILPETMALQLFTILKARNKPAFYGKDVINENVVGYDYRGSFPKHILRRIKFSFGTGIIEWWQKYLKWFLIMKTKYEQNQVMSVNDKPSSQNGISKSGVYILSLIPGFGLILSVAIFICHDCQTVKVVYRCFAKIVRAFIRKLKGQTNSSVNRVQPLNVSIPMLTETTSCLICKDIFFKNENHLLEHMVELHPEHFFVDTFVGLEKNELRDLISLILDSETQGLECRNLNYMGNNLVCPYGCVLEFESQLSLKVHLLKCHRSVLIEKLENLVRITRR